MQLSAVQAYKRRLANLVHPFALVDSVLGRNLRAARKLRARDGGCVPGWTPGLPNTQSVLGTAAAQLRSKASRGTHRSKDVLVAAGGFRVKGGLKLRRELGAQHYIQFVAWNCCRPSI